MSRATANTMKFTSSLVGLVLSVGLPSPSCAELPELLESALARADGSARSCGYTMSTVDNGTTTVERFDPVDGWTLITIDAEPPSKKRLKQYAAKSEARESRDHPDAIDFREIVDVDSIALVTDSASSATFRFKPTPDDSDGDDATSTHLEGNLVVDKTARCVSSLEMTNPEPFSPAGGVKINKMRVRMEFSLDDQGRTFLQRLDQSVDGRLFGIKRHKQASTVSYSELSCPN